MKIKVTQDHINRGKLKDCWNCPVALAIKEAGIKEVSITPGWIRINTLGTVFTPRSVLRFIKNFDRRKPVKPFNFILKGVKNAKV